MRKKHIPSVEWEIRRHNGAYEYVAVITFTEPGYKFYDYFGYGSTSDEYESDVLWVVKLWVWWQLKKIRWCPNDYKTPEQRKTEVIARGKL